MKTSKWLVYDYYCAVRIIDGGDINKLADRVAFIEKTPRVRLRPYTDHQTDFQNWKFGPKGSGCSGDDDPEEEMAYGFDPDSRNWCDEELIKMGYELS